MSQAVGSPAPRETPAPAITAYAPGFEYSEKASGRNGSSNEVLIAIRTNSTTRRRQRRRRSDESPLLSFSQVWTHFVPTVALHSPHAGAVSKRQSIEKEDLMKITAALSATAALVASSIAGMPFASASPSGDIWNLANAAHTAAGCPSYTDNPVLGNVALSIAKTMLNPPAGSPVMAGSRPTACWPTRGTTSPVGARPTTSRQAALRRRP